MKIILDSDLLGSLIGLVRATEGNEDLITNETNEIIIQALKTNDLNLINKIEQEKRRLVPDCYACGVNCGRNNNYDLNDLFKEEETIQNMKIQIINNLHTLAFDDKTQMKDIYQALFLIGTNKPSYDDLFSCLEKILN